MVTTLLGGIAGIAVYWLGYKGFIPFGKMPGDNFLPGSKAVEYSDAIIIMVAIFLGYTIKGLIGEFMLGFAIGYLGANLGVEVTRQ